MTMCAHLWAVGFDSTGRAAQVRDEITRLAREKHDLILLDVAVAVRYADGCFTLNGEPFPEAIQPHGGTIAHLLAAISEGTGVIYGTRMARAASFEALKSLAIEILTGAARQESRTTTK